MKKFALIGLGVMGNYYLQTSKLIPGLKIEQICAKSLKTLKKYPNIFKKTINFKKIEQTDGVIIASPASTHFEIAKFFISKKTPILIEKPFTSNYKDSLALERLARLNNTPILIDHTLIYHPAYIELKKNIFKIGKIKKIIFIGANNKPRKDVSILYDWGSHGISLFLDILKTSPKKMTFLKKPKKEEILVRFFFPGNREGTLDLSWASKIKKRKLIIEGDNGSIVFDDLSNEKLMINLENKMIFPTVDNIQPLENVLKEFLKILKNRKRYSKNIALAVKVASILNLVDKSLQKALKTEV